MLLMLWMRMVMRGDNAAKETIINISMILNGSGFGHYVFCGFSDLNSAYFFCSECIAIARIDDMKFYRETKFVKVFNSLASGLQG